MRERAAGGGWEFLLRHALNFFLLFQGFWKSFPSVLWIPNISLYSCKEISLSNGIINFKSGHQFGIVLPVNLLFKAITSYCLLILIISESAKSQLHTYANEQDEMLT